MRIIAGRLAKKIGLPPGTAVHTGEPIDKPVPVTLFQYDGTNLTEKYNSDTSRYDFAIEKLRVNWFNIDGVYDMGLLKTIEEKYRLHPLVAEDVANTSQRPKIDDYGDYLYLNVRMLSVAQDSFFINSEQVSFVLGKGYLFSFQEKPGDVFELIRNRLRQGNARIRRMESDYLMYSLLDAVVDHYFAVLESLEEHIHELEESIAEDAKIRTLEDIHKAKKEIIFLRRSAWPLREIVSKLERTDSNLISSENEIFLRDMYDHIMQIIEITDSFQDIVSSLLDLYLSSASNKMNSVMKTLTLVATIFIPLTFLAGIYGMNFRFMPELEWKWAYPILIGIMIIAGVSMAIYFKRKRWF